MDYPMKSFDSNNGIVVMEHDAGEFEVEILRDELSLQWNTETFLCKMKEPFILYGGDNEYYHEEYEYVVIQTAIGGNYERGSTILCTKAKEANKEYLAKLSRLDAK